jgi:hypothetical protein
MRGLRAGGGRWGRWVGHRDTFPLALVVSACSWGETQAWAYFVEDALFREGEGAPDLAEG